MIAHDYPAAHSMDTEWFAIDEHGRVARFDTGEDGAFPVAAAVGMSPADASFDELELDMARALRIIASGVELRGEEGYPPAPGRTLVALEPGADGLEGWPEGFELRSRAGEAPRLLLSREPLSRERAAELRGRPGVRWTISVDDMYELVSERELDDGLFQFARDHGDDPGRYTCARAPASPMLLDEIAEPARSAIARLRLPVDFASGAPVHLADHLEEGEAETWGDLPLRYSESYFEAQRQRAAQQQARRRGARWTLLAIVLIVAALALLARFA